jgi:transcriptional regulator NrdR family protein
LKCPTCGTWTQVLETRKRANNATRRRYECANLHRFTTVESVLAPTGPSCSTSTKESPTSTEPREENATSTATENPHGE